MSETPRPSRIERVTLFSLGAEVERVVDLEPPALPGSILIGGLPLCAHEPSFQLAVEPLPGGDPGAVPQAAGLTLGIEPPPPDPALPPAIDEELRDAERTLERAEVEQAWVERQLATLQDLHCPPRPEGAEGEPPPPSPAAARLALLAFRRAEQDRWIAALGPAREASRLAREALHALRARRAADPEQRQLAPHELRRQARIDLLPPADGRPAAPCRLRLKYLVPTARWAPAYHLALDPALGRATLALRALVCQVGDEDWRGVRLVLSTADALRWADLPRLSALRIGRARPQVPATGWRSAPLGVEALFADYDRAFGGPPARPAPQPARAARAEAEAEACEDDVAALEFFGAPTRAEAKSARRRTPVPFRAAAQAPAAPPSPARSAPLPCAPAAAPASSALPGGLPARVVAAGLDLAGALVAGAEDGAVAASEPYGEQARLEEPAALAAGASLLDYDALRLPSPAEPDRGRLRALRPDERLRVLPSPATGRLPEAHAIVAHLDLLAETLGREPLPAGYRPPRSEGAYDHAWRAERAVDVPADGKFHSVAVQTFEFEAVLAHVAVPRAGREVYRVLRLRNTLAGPLLEGPVDVDLGARSLPTCRMPAVAPGGRAELGLGVEEAIKVARNTRFSEQTRGVVSRHAELLHEIEIEVRSLLPQAADLEVRERLPVVREDEPDIKIEVRTADPAWEPWEQPEAPLRGGHRWLLRAEPGQVHRLRATYAVTLPARLELVGGNRREA